VLTFRFPCQAERQYLVWSLQPLFHLHLSHRNHLRRVPAALSGIKTMHGTGTTTTTFRLRTVILLLVFWMRWTVMSRPFAWRPLACLAGVAALLCSLPRMFRPRLGAPASLSLATETFSKSPVLPPDRTSSSHESPSESPPCCRPRADLAPADSARTAPIPRSLPAGPAQNRGLAAAGSVSPTMLE
jgi:hypothetical protein